MIRKRPRLPPGEQPQAAERLNRRAVDETIGKRPAPVVDVSGTAGTSGQDGAGMSEERTHTPEEAEE